MAGMMACLATVLSLYCSIVCRDQKPDWLVQRHASLLSLCIFLCPVIMIVLR